MDRSLHIRAVDGTAVLRQTPHRLVRGMAVTVAADQWIWLRTTVKNEGDKAICTFFYSTDGKKFKQLGETFTAAPGKWIGAKVGMFCTRAKLVTNDGGWMDADDFIIDKL